MRATIERIRSLNIYDGLISLLCEEGETCSLERVVDELEELVSLRATQISPGTVSELAAVGRAHAVSEQWDCVGDRISRVDDRE